MVEEPQDNRPVVRLPEPWPPSRPKIEEPKFTCPACGRTSYHPMDIQEKYCAACHRFFKPTELMGEMQVVVPIALIPCSCGAFEAAPKGPAVVNGCLDGDYKLPINAIPRTLHRFDGKPCAPWRGFVKK
jgi:hypothetical protein